MLNTECLTFRAFKNLDVPRWDVYEIPLHAWFNARGFGWTLHSGRPLDVPNWTVLVEQALLCSQLCCSSEHAPVQMFVAQ